ncbi:MAG: nucleotide exchange factor GrpE [Oscillospiraceae bacterium]|nr:nucleotide exchange factor GrpE [Oscillospiraceae bacterium]
MTSVKGKDKEKKAPEPQGPETEAPAEEAEEAKAAPEAPDVDALLAAEKEKYLRLAAEYDNYRKRSQKERESIFRDVKADTVTKLLPVYDNLERALKAECSDPQYKKGVELTMTQLKTIFDDLGVKPIEAVGEKFDPTLHNAVMHTESDEHDEGVIVEEFQKGFLLGDKVIRFSLVKVAN